MPVTYRPRIYYSFGTTSWNMVSITEEFRDLLRVVA